MMKRWLIIGIIGIVIVETIFLFFHIL